MNYSFKPDDVVVTSWSSAEASECFFRGVMVTHKETGIIVTSEKSFSQHENRHLAFLELEEKLKLIGDEKWK